jgi:hypothetical protein
MFIAIIRFGLTALVALAALATIIYPAAAQDSAPGSVETSVEVGRGKGTVGVAGTVVARGTVTNVNTAAREITIKNAKGDELVVPAGPEVKNFDRIKTGDQVVWRQAEAMVAELKKTQSKDGIRERVDTDTIEAAKPGQKPGIAAVRTTRVVANVTAVDRKAGTVTLRGVQASRKLKVNDPSMLADVSRGDQVELTLVEGLALTIEKPRSR